MSLERDTLVMIFATKDGGSGRGGRGFSLAFAICAALSLGAFSAFALSFSASVAVPVCEDFRICSAVTLVVVKTGLEVAVAPAEVAVKVAVGFLTVVVTGLGAALDEACLGELVGAGEDLGALLGVDVGLGNSDLAGLGVSTALEPEPVAVLVGAETLVAPPEALAVTVSFGAPPPPTVVGFNGTGEASDFAVDVGISSLAMEVRLGGLRFASALCPRSSVANRRTCWFERFKVCAEDITQIYM